MKTGSQMRIIKRVLKQLKRYIPAVSLSIFLALLTVVGNLLAPIFFGNAIDCIVDVGNVDFDKIFFYFIVCGAIIIATSLAQWIMNVINNHVVYSVVKDVREEAFNRLQHLPLKYIDGIRTAT